MTECLKTLTSIKVARYNFFPFSGGGGGARRGEFGEDLIYFVFAQVVDNFCYKSTLQYLIVIE